MASTSVSPTLVAKKRVFDLDKFERVAKSVNYTPPAPLTSIEQVQALDSVTVLSLVNKGLLRQALLDAKKTIQGVNPKAVNSMVNTFRMLPPYSGMVEKDAEGAQTPESRKKQTQAIYAFIKSNEAILQMLKDAMTAQDTEDDEDENDVEVEG